MKEQVRNAIIAIVVIVIVASAIMASGLFDDPTGLSLSGTVKHGSFDRFSPTSGYSGSDDEYFVAIDATNWGGSITYDAVQIYFDGGYGQGLSTMRVITENEESKVPKEINLILFQTDELRSQTDGYTIDVLDNSKTGKVALHVTFLYKGKVLDSFHAVLPSIIMWDEKPPELVAEEETSLHFTRDYDAVMKEVLKK